jgi:SAM-dependent methyltransferase
MTPTPEGIGLARRSFVTAQSTKRDHVRTVFDNASRYLNTRQVDMRFRTETVQAFTAKLPLGRVLDVGCGDGTISLPLLERVSHLTLLDLSPRMTELTKAKIPETYVARVEVRNEDFMSAVLAPGSFDLVISLGVLAHVDSPEEFIAKIATVLRPGGHLILAFTDARHPTGLIARSLGQLKEIIAPPKYRVNPLSIAKVTNLCECAKLQMISAFRYATAPIPDIERVLPSSLLYSSVRAVFGNCSNNRMSWLGNEYICLLTVD